MFKVIFNQEKCKGCQLCMNMCPKGIISMSNKLNEKGYYSAEILEENQDKCIGCASCGKICPDSVITIEKH